MAQTNDALLIQVDPRMTPMCMFVPRQLTRDQMTSLFPKSWITKYEALHQTVKLIQSNNPFFIRKERGEVETRFVTATLEKKEVTVFQTQMAMLQPVSFAFEKGLTIKGFREDGKPYYEGRSSSNHIWWDICDCVECKKEETNDDDHKRRRKKKSTQQILKERYEASELEVDLLGEPSRKFDYYVLYPRTRNQNPQCSPCKEAKSKHDIDQEPKPPLIPYYQNILPQLPKCQHFPSRQT